MQKISIVPNGEMRLCVDGEIYDAEKTEFHIIHNGFNILLPKSEKNNNYDERKKHINSSKEKHKIGCH